VNETAVCAQVMSDNPEHVARAVEAFARAAAGLALEGIAVSIYAETVTDDVVEDAE